MSASTRNVFLVRHGEASATWGESPDPGLSDLGWQQAREAARDLQARVKADQCTIVSSPLLRARETAQPLAEALAIDVKIDERFREIPSTVPLSERQKWLTSFMRGRWSEQSDELHHWRSQILSAIDELPPNTLIFSHFLVKNAIVGHLQCKDETLVCWPANGSITTLTSDSAGWQVQLGAQMASLVN